MTYYDLNMNNKRITNVQDPSSAQDVATKNYVDTFYYAVASSVNTNGYSISSTYTCGNYVTIVIPSTWTTFDIETITSDYFNNVPTNNGPYVLVRYGTTPPTLGSTTVPAGTLTFANAIVCGANNIQSTTQSLLGIKGDTSNLRVNANTIITPGTTYYISSWGAMINSASVSYGDHSIYVKAYRKT